MGRHSLAGRHGQTGVFWVATPGSALLSILCSTTLPTPHTLSGTTSQMKIKSKYLKVLYLNTWILERGDISSSLVVCWVLWVWYVQYLSELQKLDGSYMEKLHGNIVNGPEQSRRILLNKNVKTFLLKSCTKLSKLLINFWKIFSLLTYCSAPSVIFSSV